MKNKPIIIDLKNISVSFDDHKILDNINLYIRDGEFITFLGPSGCGKTTTLRIIAGFLQQDSGDVIFEGKNINGVPAYKRQVNTIFQRYALFPHLNVYENIAFGLRLKKWKEDAIKEKVSEMLTLVNLKGFGPRRIDSLSGGQQQRVAIARALAVNPRVVFLDEPLGALDLKLRKDMQTELKKFGAELIVEENSVTVLKRELHEPSAALCGHNDHRIVMALSLILSVTGGEISGVEAVRKSYPDFFSVIKKLGIEVTEE